MNMNRLTRWSRSALLLMAASALAAMVEGTSPAVAAPDSGQAAKYVQDGTASLAKGDLKAAEIHLKNALRVDPENVEARLALAFVYMRQEQPNAAEGALYPLYQRGARIEQVLPLLGEAYLAQNKTDELLRALDPKGLQDDARAKVQVLRARAHLQRRDAAQAQGSLDEALALRPEMPEGLLVRAELLRQSKDVAGAEAIADRVLGKDPKNVQALLLKGDIRRSLGDLEGAVGFFGKAVAEHPNSVIGRLGRAACLLALKRPADAKSDINTVLDANSKQPLALFLKASVHAAAGELAEAVNVLQPAAKEVENLFPAQVLLAEASLRLQRNEQAMQYAQRLQAMAPDSPVSRTLLAMAHLRKNEVKKALDLLEPIAAQYPSEDRLQSVLAEAYSRSGRYEAAVTALGNVLKNNPDNADLRARIDANLFRSGQRDEAVKDLDALVTEEPDAKNASVLLFALHVQSGQVAKAATVADGLRKNEPDNPLGHYLAGLAHQIMTERPRAREAFQTALKKQPTFMPAAAALAQLAALEGKPQEAKEVMEGLVKSDPKNVQAMMSLADLARSTGDLDGALAWLEKAGAAAPKEIEPAIRRVEILLQQKKSSRALAVANTLASTHPDNVRAVQTLARAQAAENDKDAAVATLRRAADLPANSAMEQYVIGQMLAGLERPDEARAALTRATKIDPVFLPAWLELALSDARAGKLDKALETAQRAAAADAALGETVKGHAYMVARKFAEADAAFSAALATRPDGRLTALRIEARKLAGDRPGARKLQEEWIAAHPGDDRIRFMYASDLIAEKDFAGSIREHETMLKKAPYNPVLLNNLAWLYAKTNDSKAVETARRAFAGAPESPDVADTLAWVLAGQGGQANLIEAEQLLAKAHEKAPKNLTIAYHLAGVLAKQGSSDKAAALLKPVIDSGQPFDEREEAEALLKTLGGGR
jgi:putative PEP-CTERM system TPR-repeat lipoprotein